MKCIWYSWSFNLRWMFKTMCGNPRNWSKLVCLLS